MEEAAVSCDVVVVWWRSAALAGSELWYCAEAGRLGDLCFACEDGGGEASRACGCYVKRRRWHAPRVPSERSASLPTAARGSVSGGSGWDSCRLSPRRVVHLAQCGLGGCVMWIGEEWCARGSEDPDRLHDG